MQKKNDRLFSYVTDSHILLFDSRSELKSVAAQCDELPAHYYTKGTICLDVIPAFNNPVDVIFKSGKFSILVAQRIGIVFIKNLDVGFNYMFMFHNPIHSDDAEIVSMMTYPQGAEAAILSAITSQKVNDLFDATASDVSSKIISDINKFIDQFIRS